MESPVYGYNSLLKSEDIVTIHSIGSWHDMGCVKVMDKYLRCYLIKGNILLQSLSYANPVFNVKKARINYYLDSINVEETEKLNKQEGR